MTISNAQVATGLTFGWFRKKVLPHLKTRPVPGKKKPEYFLTEEFLPAVYKKNHKNEFTEEEIEELENESDDIVNDILEDISVNNISDTSENVDLNEARRQEILVRTKYLEQKIDKKKNELFSEWSERFFMIFSKNFAKFKNTLIDLHLDEKQLNKLNENLDLALSNMETSLSEILNEYVNEEEEVKND